MHPAIMPTIRRESTTSQSCPFRTAASFPLLIGTGGKLIKKTWSPQEASTGLALPGTLSLRTREGIGQVVAHWRHPDPVSPWPRFPGVRWVWHLQTTTPRCRHAQRPNVLARHDYHPDHPPPSRPSLPHDDGWGM